MDIFETLKKDHEEVKTLLSELVTLSDNDDYRFVLIEQLVTSLIPHSRAEEQVFYNTLRAVNADKSLVMHGYKEHLEAETLLRTLQVMDKLDMGWRPVAEKLKDSIEHHIGEEETDIFSEARNAFTKEEAIAMADAFEELKPQIVDENIVETTVDMVINMMPPRLADSIRDFGQGLSS